VHHVGSFVWSTQHSCRAFELKPEEITTNLKKSGSPYQH